MPDSLLRLTLRQDRDLSSLSNDELAALLDLVKVEYLDVASIALDETCTSAKDEADGDATIASAGAVIDETIAGSVSVSILTAPPDARPSGILGRARMPKGPKGQKRPADVIKNAVHVMRIATGEIEEHDTRNQAALALSKLGASKGGTTTPKPNFNPPGQGA